MKNGTKQLIKPITWINCKKHYYAGQKKSDTKECYEPIDMKFKNRQNKFVPVEIKTVLSEYRFCKQRSMRELSGVMEMLYVFM